ncbi:loganic acid O-methyltransferase [Eucalyptus grandis]|uniref:Uncharacterized protein n=2 Tax=Eucalyptus grandis TaxID=71139 RepID=A0ACC3K498_EUCGR|nr:loganic acid O-methyltransferase [Eucalyptus grandis]KAK3420777.1 hypothetical protein EUGRSUZ_G01610 [Eucalyptus grandis]
MSSGTELAEAAEYTMNGGDSTYSYHKNSRFQRAATDVAKATIEKAIMEKLDIRRFSPAPTTFQIADLGCSVGPNTFVAVQNILEAVRRKYVTQGLSSQMPDFLVLFNDHVSNDFNTLFASLPPDQQYYAAGMPGSFHGRLFPEASLHVVHSAHALPWLRKLPEELLDANSPAYNKGRVYYISAASQVLDAYAAQFAKDTAMFLSARGKEVVSGGIMVLLMPGKANGIAHSCVLSDVMFDLLGACLMDMAKEGKTSEALVDSFNVPVYTPSPEEMTAITERNGCFSVEAMDLTPFNATVDGSDAAHACTMHVRAGVEGLIGTHFGSEIVNELFDRFLEKAKESSDRISSAFLHGCQLVVVLKRK